MAKTLRSRIAAVAVSAVTVAMVQALPASAATTNWTATGAYKAGALADGTVGVCVAPADLTSDGQTKTGVMTSAGSLALIPSAANGRVTADARFTVTGGTISGYKAGTAVSSHDATADTMSVTRTSLVIDYSSGADQAPTVVFTPSGVGVMQIVLAAGSYSAPTFTASSVVATWNITVSASCANSLYSAVYSSVNLATDNSTFQATDVIGANRRDNAAKGYINVSLKDAYNSALTTGLLQASATGDAFVSFSGNPTANTDFVSITDGTESLMVQQAKPGVPVTTTVTLSYNGSAIATKTITIRGILASIDVSDILVGRSGSTSVRDNSDAELGGLVALDAAGNTLNTGLYTYLFSGTGAQVPTVRVGTFNSTYRYSPVNWDCGVGAGSSKIKVITTNEAGATITSNEFTAACASSVYKYTATLDKKEYAPGDVATLTITAVDSKGNPVYDGTNLSSANPGGVNYLGSYTYTDDTEWDAWYADTTGDVKLVDAHFKSENVPVIVGGPMTAVTAPKASDYFVGGKITYTFTVGTGMSGTFNLVVSLPRYNSTATGQGNVPVTYTVKAGAADPTVLALTTAVQTMMTSIQLLMTSLSSSIAALIKALAPAKKK